MPAQHASALGALLVDEHFDGDVRVAEPMARHTTYRIGGPARYFVQVDSVGALRRLVDCVHQSELPWVVVGRGSNLLVADEGFDGVVISLGRDFRTLRFDDKTSHFLVGAGVSLSSVVQEAFKRSLAGLEFAVGTPGTIGGALRMNAGSHDEWLGSRVVNVTTYCAGEGMRRRLGSEISWEYRSSSFAPEEVVLECELALSPADPFYIRGKMEGNLAKRKKSQPLEAFSCGSVFKNPPGDSAGRLIEAVGMKGVRVGDAQVSEKHANFILNLGSARAVEVKELITTIQAKVKQVYGIELTPEVHFLGFA